MRFTTSDGLELEGWYVPSRNGAAVISFPGRAGTQKQARMLVRHGYGVLLFDRRGEGDSEGDPNSLGWGGYRDVEAAVRFLRTRPDVEPERIGAIGRSVGGEMVLEAAARSNGLSAVVSEGAGARSIREGADSDNGANPVWSAGLAVQTAGVRLFSNEPVPEDLEEPRRTHLRHPRFPGLRRARAAAARSSAATTTRPRPSPKQLWEVPRGGHVGGIDVFPREYERRVVGFFDDALLG